MADSIPKKKGPKKLHWPGIEPGADRIVTGNDPGYHYPTSALLFKEQFITC